MEIALYITGHVSREKEERIREGVMPARVFYAAPDIRAAEPVLWLGEEGLALAGRGLVLRGDLADYAPRARAQNLRTELLLRACRIKDMPEPMTVCDATAGLGEDSFVLAAAGHTVEMYEKDPVIAALLSDALDRAGNDPELAPIAARMRLREGDSIRLLRARSGQGAEPDDPDISGGRDRAPDVVYLDPMFPAKKKRSLTGKKMQLLQLLEMPCEDEEELLAAAEAANPAKIVIKRPLKGPFLGGARPDHSIEGKNIRYDVIQCALKRQAPGTDIRSRNDC